jgi:hypothetical protein
MKDEGNVLDRRQHGCLAGGFLGAGTPGTPPGTPPDVHKTIANIGLARRYGRYGQKTPPGGKKAASRRKREESTSALRLAFPVLLPAFTISAFPSGTRIVPNCTFFGGFIFTKPLLIKGFRSGIAPWVQFWKRCHDRNARRVAADVRRLRSFRMPEKRTEFSSSMENEIHGDLRRLLREWIF